MDDMNDQCYTVVYRPIGSQKRWHLYQDALGVVYLQGEQTIDRAVDVIRSLHDTSDLGAKWEYRKAKVEVVE